MTFLMPLSVVIYKMVIKWTRTARECFTRISSERFTIEETMNYKRHLVKEIERKNTFDDGVNTFKGTGVERRVQNF